MMNDETKNLTLGSLFDGIAGFPLAAEKFGIKTLWTSEIEPAPCEISKRHFPEAEQLGDVTKINGAEIPPVDIISFGSPCLTADSLILTKRGYKRFDELNIGDMVLTKSNTWHPINKIFNNGIHETVYIQAQGFENIHCTPEHKFYARKMTRVWDNTQRRDKRTWSPPEFVEAKNLIPSCHYLGVPVIEEEIPFATRDKEFWYMAGYYIGDGWLEVKPGSVAFAASEEKFEKIRNNCSWEFKKHKNGANCSRLTIHNTQYYKWISRTFGTGSGDKHIPLDVITLPKEELSAFFQGYMDADDCIYEETKTQKFTSVNRSLVYSISLIVNKLFHTPTNISLTKVSPTKVIEGRVVNQKDYYDANFRTEYVKQSHAFYEDGYIWYPFRKLEQGEPEQVFNMEVDEDHSYIVQGCISKNCQDLSVAGNQAGLDGSRSGLFHEAVRIIREMREKTNGIYPAYAVWENVCFTAGTLITTEQGYKNIEDIHIGEKVKTLSGEYMPVVKVYKTKRQNIMQIISSGSEPIKCTLSHPFLVKKRITNSPYVKYKNSFSEPEWMEAKDIEVDSLIGYVLDKPNEEMRDFITKDEAWAIGRWLADGSVDISKSSPRIFISCGNKKIEDTREHLSHLPYIIHENRPHATALNFAFTSWDFYKLIESADKGAGNKRVPPYIFNLPLDIQREVLDGYVSGDGYIRTRNNTTEFAATTASRQLAYGIMRLVRNCWHVGCSLSVRPPKNGEINNRIVKANYPSYAITATIAHTKPISFVEDGILWQPVKKIEYLNKKDTVYNLSVKEDNTYEVNNIIVHNCGAFSSHKGADFRRVLQELAETEIPIPKGGKWAESGLVELRDRSIAWRVIDAQYWGVPQRRKRIFLIADFRGQRAGEILFKSESVPRDIEESAEARERTPVAAESGS